MKGSSLILPGLAPPVQVQPQQQAPHFSASTTLASQFQSCRRVRQNTIRLQRQDVPSLDIKLRVEFLGVKHFPSSFHGDGKALKQQIPWSKENVTNTLTSYPIRGPKRTVDVQCFSRPFDESPRPRGNYPSRVTQLPAEPPRTLHSANVDLNKARDINAPREFDQSAPPSPPDFVPPGRKGRPVTTGSSISEHRSSRRAQESTSSRRAPSPANERPGRRFETSYVVREAPLSTRSPNRIASSNFYPKENLRTIEARVESENVIPEQAVLANVYSPSRRRVQQAFYEFRDPWRLKKSKMASEPLKREVPSAESYRPVGATGRRNDVAQLEAQSPQSRAGAAKWREAANVIEQNRNPSHKVLGGIESLQQTTDSLNVEPDRAVDRKANRTRSITAKAVLEIRQRELLSREKEGQSTPISEGWVTHYGRRDSCRDTPQGNDPICIGGSMGQAVAVLQNRLQRGVTTDSGTYVKALQMCLKQKDLFAAKQVHDCIVQSGMDKILSLAGTLLNVYIKCGGLADARRVFDQLEKKSVVAWTNMIAAYAKSHHAKSALELFNQMRKEGVEPNAITYLSILKACTNTSTLKWGEEIHECIRHTRFESDVRVGTALLHMYAKCGCIMEAREVFDRLKKRNVVTWTVMIGGLAQHGCGHEAYRLFLQMIREGCEPDAIAYVSILNASASAGALDWVKDVHGHASRVGLESDLRVGNALVHMYAKSGSIDDARLVFDRMEKRDVFTWTLMIGGLAEHGCGHEAYRLFLQMIREGCEPDAFTYASILNASASAGALEWVKDVHGHASKAGLESDLRVGNALVHMYAKSGSIEDARKVFDRTEKRDVVTWNVMIGGLAEYGHGHEAYRLFLQMRRKGFEPNVITYISILNASASVGVLDWVKEVHGHASKAGVESDMRVGSALVHMYAKSGSIDDALRVFERMDKRDVVTWNVMIGGLAEHGHGHEAYRLFLQMRHEGFEPNAITYLSVLNASASAGALEWVKEVQGHASRAGLELDIRVGNALVHMYAKSGSIADARLVFDRMEQYDVFTWTVMIGGLAEHGCGHEAYRLFLQMIREGCEPDAFTYASILNASASAGALEWVKDVHGHARRAGLESDMRVGNALVHMYAKSGSIDDARLVFDGMEKRDVCTWNVMIGGLAEHGCGHEAYRLFLQMIREGCEPDAFTFASILNASASAGALEWVKDVHGHASKAGLESDLRVGNALVHMYAKSGSIDNARLVFDRMQQRDVFTWNVIIGGLAEHGCGHEAYRLFLQMIREGCEPDAFTYASILNASASAGALEWVKDVHGHASRAGLESDMRVGNALVHMYAKSGSIDDARLVFDRMEKRDVFTWNVMIGGFAEHGCGHEAYRLFLQMIREGCEPDAFTYASILNASASAGALEWVKDVHGHASKAGLESDMRVGNALVHMYAKSGSVDDARLVFDRMEQRDVVTWNVMIGGLAQHGCGHEAYCLFLQMIREGCEPDAFTYASILNASASAGALEWVKDVHGHASKAGLESDIRVGNALVHMYAKSGSIDDARLVFDRMEQRDVCTWNVMIGGLAQHGCGHEAYRLFLQMIREGCEPDAFTYASILNASASAGALEWVKDVHGHASRAGLESDMRVGNALVHMYAKSGSIDDARLVFHRMEKRDGVTWNVMIGGLAELGCGHEAYRLFLQMVREGCEPDAFTYASILNASASAGALEWVKDVHGHASKAGLESDIRVGNALVHMYAKSGSIDDARLVFDRMEQRDVFTWNVMIGGLAQHGCGHEAYRLFLQMIREGCEPDAFTYASILNASASAGALEWVKDVHGHASRAGLESDMRVGNALVHMYAKSGSIDDARLVFDRMEKSDVVTWNVMIGGLAQHGCGHEAYRLFLQMIREGCEPDAFTYASILNASASAGALEWVKDVHGHASKAGLESDLRVGNALVHMYAKTGSIDDARLVFDRMERRDVCTWNVMIGGLAQHGCGHEAVELFRKMIAGLENPDETTFAVVLSACCHRGLVGEGHRLFSAMTQDYGIEPDIVHYTCMVDLLGRAGHLEEARLFISDMPIEPDAVTWKAFLGACRTYGNVELGELAAEELFKLVPSDASAYVLLSNIYAAAGKWENVSLVRTMMQTRGVRKKPGRSWIEVDKKIHEFVVGDTSHPEAKAIYNELNKLTEKLKAEGYIPDTRLVLHDISEEDKELALCFHSEKLAIAYGLMHIPQDEPICVWKNLRVCPDCHTATKLISKVTGREIIARDANRFHHFKDGICSCADYW